MFDVHAHPGRRRLPAGLTSLLADVRDCDDIAQGQYGVLEVVESWEVASMLEVVCPGVEHHFERGDDGSRTAWMLHADG